MLPLPPLKHCKICGEIHETKADVQFCAIIYNVPQKPRTKLSDNTLRRSRLRRQFREDI